MCAGKRDNMGDRERGRGTNRGERGRKGTNNTHEMDRTQGGWGREYKG